MPFHDFRIAFRSLLKRPGFAVVAVLTLAIGIGANTTIFSVVNAVLFKPLPFANPERLVIVGKGQLSTPGDVNAVSFPDFNDYRARNRSFEQIAAYYLRGAIVSEGTRATRVRAATVSANLFSVLGVQPTSGRAFLPEEEKSGKGRVVILSHGFRDRRFGTNADAIGKKIDIGGTPFDIVGVMPAGFRFPYDAESVEMWISIGSEAEPLPGGPALTEQRGNQFLTAIGRLKPGVTRQQADADLGAVAAELAKQFPEMNADATARTRPLAETLTGDVRPALFVMFGAVGFVLLIACANIAGLQLARATGRRKELAVQAALGAGRGDLVRKLLMENLIVALLGGTVGTLLAVLGLRFMTSGAPGYVPRLSEATLDFPTLAFSAGITLLTGFGFGLAPALLGSRVNLNGVLREGGRGETGQRQTLRGVLVIGQVAIAVMLLIGATLMIRSFTSLMAVETGYRTDHLLTMRVSLPDNYYNSPPLVAAFHQRLIDAVGKTPGLKDYTTVTPIPFGGEDFYIGFGVEGRPTPPENPFPNISAVRLVGPNYFKTMNTAVRRGRDFTERDRGDARETVIINETAARKYFPNEDPIGKRINPSISVEPGPPHMREIVGVVADSRRNSLSEDNRPEVFIPIAQLPALGSFSVVARTEGDPMLSAGQIREDIARIDATIPVSAVRTFDDLVYRSAAQPRFVTLLLGFFGGVALLLTSVGLYGIVSAAVANRTREIGIRMALGAQIGQVLRLVLRQGLTLILIGLAIGLTGAFFLNRLMASLLFKVSPTDPITYFCVPAMLAAVTLAACWLPARRAAKTDPMEALRHES